ncbi:hypothetical protein V5O48_018895, partial [Marasmius crinis-equi]
MAFQRIPTLLYLLAALFFISVAGQPNPALQIRTIRTAFEELGTRVTRALRIQVGDTTQLIRQQESAQRLLLSVEQRGHLFDEDEFNMIVTSITGMIQALDEAQEISRDIIEHKPVVPTRVVHTGNRGRPRKELDPLVLQTGLNYRGPTHLAPVFDCSSRTVRRRALEYGMAEPCPPVYVIYEDPETGEL